MLNFISDYPMSFDPESYAGGWHCVVNGVPHGPMSAEELRACAPPDALVWREGQDGWKPLSAALPPPLPAVGPAAGATPAAAGASPVVDEISVLDKLRGNYFVRHWRGELSVGRSYWLNIFLVNLAWTVIVKVVTLVGLEEIVLLPRAAGWLVFTVILYGLIIWQVIGLVRASLASPSTFSRRWGIVGALILIGGTIYHSVASYYPVTKEMVLMLAGDPDIPAMKIDVLKDGAEIEMRGGIPAGSSRDVIAALRAHPNVKVLHVNSDGGRAYDALKIAAEVERLKLTTVVDLTCESGGTIVFLAGQRRVAMHSSRIGFHRATVGGPSVALAQPTNDQLASYYTKRGVKRAFVDNILSTPGASMWRPSLASMVEAGFLTEISDGIEFAPSRILVETTPADFAEAMKKEEAFRILAEAVPDEFAQAAAQSHRRMVEGSPTFTALDPLRELLGEEVARSVPIASGEGLDKMIDLLLLIADRLGDQNPEAVYEIFEGNVSHMGALRNSPLYPTEEDLAATRALLSNRNKSYPIATQAEASALIAKVVAHLKEHSPDDLALFQKEKITASEGVHRMKAMMISMRTALPESDRHKLLRSFYVPQKTEPTPGH